MVEKLVDNNLIIRILGNRLYINSLIKYLETVVLYLCLK